MRPLGDGRIELRRDRAWGLLASLVLLGCKPSAVSKAPTAPDAVAGADVAPVASAVPDPDPDPVVSTAEVDEPAEPARALQDAPAPIDEGETQEVLSEARGECSDMGEERFVYAIGSSTLASLLGPTLKRRIKRRWPDVTFRKWGKSSSGMARPDFHDWIDKVPTINTDYDPDIYIVNLGTNDAQPLWDPVDRWIHANTPEWEQRYGERVDKILELMAGEDRRRIVVWVGPTAFPKKNSRRIGPTVNNVLKQRIEAFDGRAYFVDAFTATSPSRGKYIETVTYRGKQHTAYGHDGIHLTNVAVTVLMAKPVLELLERCLDERSDGAGAHRVSGEPTAAAKAKP